jgi:hypothetical protein
MPRRLSANEFGYKLRPALIGPLLESANAGYIGVTSPSGGRAQAPLPHGSRNARGGKDGRKKWSLLVRRLRRREGRRLGSLRLLHVFRLDFGSALLCSLRLRFGRELLLDLESDGVGVHFVDRRCIPQNGRAVATGGGEDDG